MLKNSSAIVQTTVVEQKLIILFCPSYKKAFCSKHFCCYQFFKVKNQNVLL